MTPHRMYKTQYAIQGRWRMNEFCDKHFAVCRRLFVDKKEAELNGLIYLKEIVDKSHYMAESKQSIFTLSLDDARFDIIEMDVEI